MANTNVSHIMHGVEALYPRINQPYRFDQSAGENGKSVPCDPFDDGAKYDMSIRMDKAQATELYKVMSSAYNERKDAKWPAMPKASEAFEKDEDGKFIAKTVLKAAYGKEATKPPAQYDAKNKLLGEDFLLTTGSKINVQLVPVPYNMQTNGVSLRLRAVQVIELAEMKEYSPFGEEDGFSEAPSGFGSDTDEIDEVEVEAKPAPKKAEVKVADADEIDVALDNLDFDD